MNFFKKLYEPTIKFVLDNFLVIGTLISSPIIFYINATETLLKAHMHITLTFISILLICSFFMIQYLYSNSGKIYRFSVWWNKKAIPHCCVCNKIVIIKNASEAGFFTPEITYIFFCLFCKESILSFDDKNPIDAREAIKIMEVKLGIN